MQFKPKTEEEISRLFEKGRYPFKVIDAEEKKSKKGNDMIVLDVELRHNTIPGKTNRVKCYLIFDYLIRHFCYATGLVDEYNSGNLFASSIKGKEGIADVIVEVDKEGKYPDKNKIVDFIEKSSSQNGSNLVNSSSQEDLDDDLPF